MKLYSSDTATPRRYVPANFLLFLKEFTGETNVKQGEYLFECI